ncbi:MAG: site-specific DNA-methyltransferase [Defluviitaleaceae bacterium]|nr:site-specific DNA-methyltransferase [Defluviitaleaceae bacterium]MCL2263941.1 site-specific DNA-methyltransferase [Defluviitaleaceae bacterium]
MEKLDGMSMDIEQTERNKLQSLFPQCFKEGKLDVDMLLNLCGEYIDEDFEKYKFEWKGKAECFRIAGKPSTGTLRPCPDESVNFDTTKNLYIEGDNLEVLKLLQTAYFRKVKMIYIDPPYNTGNDFVYNDNFADPIAHYKEITSQATKSNPESMGRFHTAWLNMMYPRLRLAANLLRDDGVIFISIDDNEVHNLRKICDEIFGEENFEGHIHWRRRHNQPNDKTKMIGLVAEHILVYAKNSVDLRIAGVGKIDLTGDFSNPDNDPRGDWASKPWKVGSDQSGSRYTIILPNGKVLDEEWMGEESTFKDLLTDNRIVFPRKGDGMPRKKYFRFEREAEGQSATNWWEHTRFGHNQGANDLMTELFGIKNIFSNPKPIELLRGLVQIANVKDDELVLDFFAGSCSTAHAVMQLNAEDGKNRQFIMVQLPEVTNEKSEAYKSGYKNICNIGKERIRRAGAKILTEWQEKQKQLEINEQAEQTPPDTGFKVLKLDTSNLHAWDGTPITDGNVQTLWNRFDAREKTIKRDRANLDIVYEVMLKMGIHLDYIVSEITVGSKKCYAISKHPLETSKENMVLVCLEFGITPEDITAFCNLAPKQIIIAEEAFEDSIAMSNAHYILKDRDIEMKLL